MKTLKLFVISTVWVEPNSSAAGSRMLQLLELFAQNGWQITYGSTATKSDKKYDLSKIGVDEVIIHLNSQSFDEFIKVLQPDIVVFDRFMVEEQFGWRVAENCPGAIRILDTEDLHFLRKVRHKQFKANKPFSHQALLQSDDAKREIAAILRCDLSLIISTYEMELLQSVFKIEKQLLYYLPFLLNKINQETTKKWASFEERKGFVFIGNFLHKPNVDAVLTLKNHIWDHIKKKLPQAEMHIYGAYITQQVSELHDEKNGFFIKGFAENASQVISKASVMLAPLNFGAGIKGKLTDAMQCGTPSVTTIIGAEGMYDGFDWPGFITDDFEQFAAYAVQLYLNKSDFESAQKKGTALINNTYYKEKRGHLFIQKTLELKEDLDNHRIQNFLGSLLQHQTLLATKYMSKWIELKNNI